MSRRNLIISALIFLFGLIVFWSSAYPSIIWWETGDYATAALGPGITGPPGSIFLTLAGWIISKLPADDPAKLFNLFSGFIGALAVALLYILYTKIEAVGKIAAESTASAAKNAVLLLAGGIIICGTTLWEYSVMFAPYILTGLFTVFILMAVLKWWEKADESSSWKYVLLIALLTGADFSVHRTNMILVPGIIAMMLVRKASVFSDYRSYLAAAAGLLAGLLPQLLYIPIARSDPSMNMGDPQTLSGLWYYFSLKQYGGNFLLDIFQRKGPLFSYQIPYYFKGLADNYFYFDRNTVISGVLPGLLGLIGIWSLFKKNRKLGTAMILLFLITIFFSIIYFNLPANYFRTIYRHYLPSFLVFSLFIFEGSAFVLGKLSSQGGLISKLSTAAFLMFLAASLLVQFGKGYSTNSGARNYFTAEHASNLLSSADSGAIIFSYGDNDHFPMIYMQDGKNMRKDIVILNLSLLNADWYLKQIERHYPGFPLRMKGYDIGQIDFPGWKKQTETVSLSSEVKKRYRFAGDSVVLELPAIRGDGNLLQDLALFDIITANRWERPVYFIKGGVETEIQNWLKPHLRDEGLLYSLVPDTAAGTDFEKLAANLGKYDLGGYNSAAVRIDNLSAERGNRYYEIFASASEFMLAQDRNAEAVKILTKMKEALPVERLHPDENILSLIDSLEKKVGLSGK
jgi:hypothetical protein